MFGSLLALDVLVSVVGQFDRFPFASSLHARLKLS